MLDEEKIRLQIRDGSIYNKPRYKAWRRKVYVRDNYTCRMCGTDKAYLNAHHIKTKYKNPQLIYTVDNGITLCVSCHRKVTGCEEDYVSYFNELVKDSKKVLKPRIVRDKKRAAKRRRLIRRIFK